MISPKVDFKIDRTHNGTLTDAERIRFVSAIAFGIVCFAGGWLACATFYGF